MTFKTQAEIYQALLDGKKITHNTWADKAYIYLTDLGLKNQDGYLVNQIFHKYTEWHLYEEPKEPSSPKTLEIDVFVGKNGAVTFDVYKAFERNYKIKNLRIEDGKLLGDIDE